MRSAEGTLAEVPRNVRSNIVGPILSVAAANCHGAGVQVYYISDERGFPRPRLKNHFEPPFGAGVMVDTNGVLMALQQRKRKMPPSKPRKDEERDTASDQSKTPTRPRARIAISFTAVVARWTSEDPRI